MLRTSLLALAALGLAACASTPTETASTEGRDCFLSSQVNGYSIVDDHHVRVTVGANRHYILGTSWNTNDLNWTEAIALHSGPGNICVGSGIGVEIRGGEPRRTYPVTEITREPDPIPAGS